MTVDPVQYRTEETTDGFPCICDPADLFNSPDLVPRAVEGCPAHRYRYAFQCWLERQGGADHE